MAPPLASDSDHNQLVVLARNQTTAQCDYVYPYPLDQETESRLQNSGYVLEPSDVVTVLDRLSRRNDQESAAGPSNVQASGRAASVTRQQVSGPPFDRHLTHHINDSIANRLTEHNERMQQSLNKFGDSLKRKLDKRQDSQEKRIKHLETIVSGQRKELSVHKMHTKKQNEKIKATLSHQDGRIKKLEAADIEKAKVMSKLTQNLTQLDQVMTSLHSSTGEHSGVENLRCTTCYKPFATKSKLMIHLVTHNVGPTFSCKYANCKRAEKPFPEVANLQKHIRNVHAKSYQCRHSILGSPCIYMATTFGELENHCRKKHGTESGFLYRKVYL